MKFEEIGRIQTNDTTYIVISNMSDDKEHRGYTIGKYIESEAYTGFAKGGVSISDDNIVEFLKLFGKENLKEALKGVER